jgi:hypothetical protein
VFPSLWSKRNFLSGFLSSKKADLFSYFINTDSRDLKENNYADINLFPSKVYLMNKAAVSLQPPESDLLPVPTSDIINLFNQVYDIKLQNPSQFLIGN